MASTCADAIPVEIFSQGQADQSCLWKNFFPQERSFAFSTEGIRESRISSIAQNSHVSTPGKKAGRFHFVTPVTDNHALSHRQ
jgi:hypothetical protein